MRTAYAKRVRSGFSQRSAFAEITVSASFLPYRARKSSRVAIAALSDRIHPEAFSVAMKSHARSRVSAWTTSAVPASRLLAWMLSM